MTENDSTPWTAEDLTARVRLSMPATGGDLDVCVFNDFGAQVGCSTRPGTQEETVSLIVEDRLEDDDSADFYVRITGWPPEISTNNWTLTVTGNTS